MYTERLKEHLDDVLSTKAYDWFVICLQGSQNYGLSDDESDIDSKLLVLPSFEDLALNRKAVSYTHIMENDEHCDVKDVREYFKLFKKQNINFVEILFTDYYIVNPKYEQEWNELRKAAEAIGYYDPIRTVKASYGMMLEKEHALCHEYPSRMFLIERWGFDPKQLSHIFRLKDFLTKYTAGEDYKDCITPSNRDFLLNIKRNSIELTKDQAIFLADFCKNDILFIKDNFIETFPQNSKQYLNNKEQIDKLLEIILIDLLRKSLNIGESK